LSYIFGELKNTQVNQRALSGLLLKNSVRQHWQAIPPTIKQFLKQHCFTAIAEESALLRATTGIIITTIFCHEGCVGWPELLPTLCQMLESGDKLKILVSFFELRCVFICLISGIIERSAENL
jgi:transportin-1